MEKLNNIESQILTAIIKENKIEYPFLENHFQYLYVKDRENTGVGFYINFEYSKDFKNDQFENINTLLSSKKNLTFDSFKSDIAYVLDIAKGRINLLEFVINGDERFENEKIFDYLILS